MTKQKQTNNETGAVLTREIPEQDRSLITVPQELQLAYPNVQPEYMQKALERCREQPCPEDVHIAVPSGQQGRNSRPCRDIMGGHPQNAKFVRKQP